MGKRSLSTPRSIVRHALRLLWLHSRERAAALKAAGYCCEECGVKQSKAKGREVKVEVHHSEGAQLEHLVDEVFKHLLCDPKLLEVACKDCHEKLTRSQA